VFLSAGTGTAWGRATSRFWRSGTGRGSCCWTSWCPSGSGWTKLATRSPPCARPTGFAQSSSLIEGRSAHSPDAGSDVGQDERLTSAELYQRAGVNLAADPLVGVGSVCRRQATGEIEVVVHSLASLGQRLHGFGVKAGGLVRYADCLASADSLAWSFEARRAAPLAGCSHANCANCACATRRRGGTGHSRGSVRCNCTFGMAG
jgi:hypothetical protein